MDVFYGFVLGIGVAVLALGLAVWMSRSGFLFDDEGNVR